MGDIGAARIFLPVLVVVALTVIGFIYMAIVRMRSIRRRETPLSFYRAHQGAAEPELVAASVRHYANLFEAPVLFYVGCIVAFLISAVSSTAVLAAWGYAIARVIQSLIHLTSNNVRLRAFAFLLAWICLLMLWIMIAIRLLAATTST